MEALDAAIAVDQSVFLGERSGRGPTRLILPVSTWSSWGSSSSEVGSQIAARTGEAGIGRHLEETVGASLR